MPYFFTERENQSGARGGFEDPPPPPPQQQQQQKQAPASESEQRTERPVFTPPPARAKPKVVHRPASPQRYRGAPHEGSRTVYRAESPPPRYTGSRSERPHYDGPRSEPPRYQGARPEPRRYESARSEPPRYGQEVRQDMRQDMRYDGTDRWPPSSSYRRGDSIPSAPEEVQRYSDRGYDRGYERGRIISGPSRDAYDVPPSQSYSVQQRPPHTADPRGGAAAGPGQVVISAEEYRALQSQARELQRLMGERNGGYRVSRPGSGPITSYPGTSYR
jgi:hypothetical protein